MKKGNALLLSVFAASICFVFGMFLGRNTMGNYTLLPVNRESVVISDDSVKDYRLNINYASKMQLMELEGIGEVMAQRIIDYREENGPYQFTEDIMNVDGLGPKKFSAIEPYISVGG